jgi:hypothetical protein
MKKRRYLHKNIFKKFRGGKIRQAGGDRLSGDANQVIGQVFFYLA